MKVTKTILALLLIPGALWFAACAPAVDSETHWQNSDPDGNGANSEERDAGYGNGEEDADIADSGPLPDPADAGEEEPLPEIRVLPEELVFEEVAIGGEEIQVVELINDSDEVVGLTGVDIADGFSVGELPEELEPGAVHPLEVIFSPTVEGAYVGIMEIHWTGGEEQTISVGLSGNLPCVEVSTEEVDFGKRKVGDLTLEYLLVTNCAAAMAVTVNPEVQETGEESVFGVADEEDYPMDLEAGATMEIMVVYVPETVGLATGTLLLEVDPLIPMLEVSLVGEAEVDDGG